jgi:mono/diheme cytochrome c family protein
MKKSKSITQKVNKMIMSYKNNITLLLLVAYIILTGTNSYAQPWTVPDEYQKMAAPFLFDAKTVKAGEVIYMKNCKSCHGDPGKNNVAKITPVPKDPVSKEYQNQSDGSLFYKMSTGRGPMPSFANILKEEERWQVISYVRSFNPAYKQPPVQAAGQATKGKNIKITMDYDAKRKIVILKVRGLSDDKQIIKIANVRLNLSVKRNFGNLLIGESTTNENGFASIAFPDDLPGDTQGNLQLIARINNAALGEIEKDTMLKIGTSSKYNNILDKRAMWNANSKAPLWVIFSYTGVVLLVWGTIFYILLELRKIKIYNSKTN